MLSVILFTNNAYSEESKDHLLCTKYIESVVAQDLSISKGMHNKMKEYTTYFHHQVNLKILNNYKGVKNPEFITSETYKVTELALKTLTPKYVYTMCKERTSGTMEEVSRATWLTIQEMNNQKG